jgi:hypothetical protein
VGRESGMEAPFVGETGPVRVKFQGSGRWKSSAVRSRALAQPRPLFSSEAPTPLDLRHLPIVRRVLFENSYNSVYGSKD